MQKFSVGFNSEASFTLEDGRTLNLGVFPDDCPDSPRNWDNLGAMVCWHSRYNLGDDHDFTDPTDFFEDLAHELDPSLADTLEYWEYESGRNDWEDKRDQAIDRTLKQKVGVILPLYLYDHSGITMSAKPFSCRWDSGQVGYIFVSKDAIRREYNVSRISKKTLERATQVLEGEVETYDQYLRNDIYGHSMELTHPETCSKCKHTEHVSDHEHSCWGYYGTGYMLEEMTNILKCWGIEAELSINW